MNAWWGVCVCVCAAAWGGAAAADGCDVVIGRGTYREDVLVPSAILASGLAVDFKKSTLYYSSSGWDRNRKIDLKSKVSSVIEELGDRPCEFTVDRKRGYVHAGCSSARDSPGGLFAWDSHPARFVVEGDAGHDVGFVHYYNKTLYYSRAPDYELRTFVKGRSAIVPAFPFQVLRLVVAAPGDFVFYNSTGVYRRREGGELVYYEFKGYVRALAMDSHGNAYACSYNEPRGVWRLDDDAPTATRLLDVGCSGLTFDADRNLIYSNPLYNRIVRLLPC